MHGNELTDDVEKLEALLTELQELEQERGVGEDMQEPVEDFGDDDGLDFEDNIEFEAREVMSDAQQAAVDASFEDHVREMLEEEENLSEKELDDELYEDEALEGADDDSGKHLSWACVICYDAAMFRGRHVLMLLC